jgi:hypothetical protein
MGGAFALVLAMQGIDQKDPRKGIDSDRLAAIFTPAGRALRV